MNHPKDNILKAYLDGELLDKQTRDITTHLQNCPKCQAKILVMRETTKATSSHIDAMLSNPPRQPLSNQKALNLLYAQERKMYQQSKIRKLRPLWISLTIAAVFIVAFTFQPVRAFASELLSLFRVQQLSTIQIDTSSLQQFTSNPTFGETLSEVLSDSVTVTREKEESQTGLDAETVKSVADFSVRLPSDMNPEDITYEPGIAFEVHVDTQQVEDVLTLAGKEDLQIPDTLKDANITVDIPNSVTAVYGECKKPNTADPDDGPTYHGSDDCLLFMQMPSPTVDSSNDIDTVEIADFGLQFLGMDPSEASQLSQKIDWKTTLVVPIPMGKAESEDIEVDGVQGILVRADDPEDSNNEFTLVWLKNDLIYAIFGYGDPTKAVTLANSLE